MKKWEALDEARFWFLQNGKEYDMDTLIELDDLLAEIKQILVGMEGPLMSEGGEPA